MSRQKHLSKKKNPGTRKNLKNNNVYVFKLADPVIQSLIFIFLIYSIDSEDATPVRLVYYCLCGWQLLSWVINLFIRSIKQLTGERIFFLGTELIFLAIYFFVKKVVHEKNIHFMSAEDTIPLYEVILLTCALLIAFWYFFICYREVRDLLKTEKGDFGN